MKALELNNISKKYGSGSSPIVEEIVMDLEKGEFLALVGESGSGKTTLLRLIAGLEKPDRGEIRIGGELMSSADFSVPPEARNVGMVFQDYALFPHLKVSQNVNFGLNRWPKSKAKGRVEDVLEIVGLSEMGHRYPHELSGGEQQRVALARAMAPRPDVLLLDEPFSNLDTQLKDQVRTEVRNILKTAGISTLFVTHDTVDALSTSDRIAIIQQGRLQQTGDPSSIYLNPANPYVANFFGNVNVMEANVKDGIWQTQLGPVKLDYNGSASNLLIMIRPDCFYIAQDETAIWSGKVKSISYLGGHYQLRVEVAKEKGEKDLVIHTREELGVGQLVGFGVNIKDIHIFS